MAGVCVGQDGHCPGEQEPAEDAHEQRTDGEDDVAGEGEDEHAGAHPTDAQAEGGAATDPADEPVGGEPRGGYPQSEGGAVHAADCVGQVEAAPDILQRRFLSTGGVILNHGDQITVRLDRRTYSPVLRQAEHSDQRGQLRRKGAANAPGVGIPNSMTSSPVRINHPRSAPHGKVPRPQTADTAV